MSRCEERPAPPAAPGPGQPRHGRAHARTRQRGAALIVAIAIMTILLAIALTFYSVSKTEFDTSTNVINSVRSDLQADGAIAQAIAHLNEDFLRHPGATSTDHSWRSFFNGAWVAGKPWLMKNGRPLNAKGLPQVNLYAIERIIGNALGEDNLQLTAVFPDGRRERLFRGNTTRSWLYIPRLQRNELVIYDRSVRIVYPQRNGGQINDVELLSLAADGSFATDQINPALAASGLRFVYFLDDPDIPGGTQQPHPFVTSDLYGRVVDPATGSAAFPVPAADTDGLQYPAEQVNVWADVDNDGDGLRDAVWFPMQADQFFPTDGVDNDLDGMVDETQDDGLDNDGDGAADVDAGQAVNANPNEVFRPIGSNPVFDVDENIEGAPFIYHGLGDIDPDTGLRQGDGLDNNGNGQVDEVGANGEDKLFLTSPIPGMRIQVDLNNDGLLNEDDLVPDAFSSRPVPVYVQMPSSITVRFENTDVTLTAQDVDVLDNDYDGEVNETDAYAYVGPHTNAVDRGYPAAGVYDRWQPYGNWGAESTFYTNAHERGYIEINVDRYVRDGASVDIVPLNVPATFGVTNGTAFLQLPNALRVTISGEPVCNLVGRASVYVADESGKLNANVAGALTYRDQPLDGSGSGGFTEGLLQRATSSGSGPAEIDLRTLPGIGVALAQRITAARYGAPGGLSISSVLNDPILLDGDTPAEQTLRPYYYDVSLPGYGRVDDNANTLLLGLDRRNNNGDQYGGGYGLKDEGMYLPRLSALATGALIAGGFDTLTAAEQDQVISELRSTRFDEYYRRLGVFEGIDEPEEFRRFRSTRNFLAERSGVDNDNDGTIGELGELGDAAYQSYDQIVARVAQIGSGIGDRLRPLLGVHSTDRNVTFFGADDGLRALNRVDYNFAPAAQIAGQLLLTGAFTPVTDRSGAGEPGSPNNERGEFGHNVAGFAEGLRQADVGLNGAGPALLDDSTSSIPADPVLQALLAAASIVDNRDTDHARTLLRTEDRDLIPGVVDNRRYTPSFSLGVPIFAAWPPSKEAIPLRDRIEDAELMPMEEVEEFLRTPLAIQDDRTELITQASIAGPAQVVDNSAAEGLRRLQSLDSWWANFVRADVSTDTERRNGDPSLIVADAQVAEQRTISFAAAGAEAIRINELMVRPVRRVEAEMVNFAPGQSATYPPALDPLFALVDTGDVPATETRLNALSPTPWDSGTGEQYPLPLFNTLRSTSGGFNVPLFAGGNVAVNPGAWFLTGDFLRTGGAGLVALGDTAGMTNADPAGTVTSNLATGALPLPFPNVLEFSFAGDLVNNTVLAPDLPVPIDELNGLPSGRYYLTMNIANADGTPSVLPVSGEVAFPPFTTPAATAPPAGIYYTIKYVYNGPETGAEYDAAKRAIVDDMQNYYQQIDTPPTGILKYQSYFDTFWKPVPEAHFSQGAFGERAGWVFLDGTQQELYNGPNAYADFTTTPGEVRPGAYFAEFADNVDFQPYPAYETPFPLYDYFSGSVAPVVAANAPLGTFPGGLTHTVYVPPANSLWRLHVAITSPDPITVNFFDFSQEPDHEYIELTNISDEPIDLSGWELEIGIPDVVDGTTGNTLSDPFASKWQVPAGTQIAQGGYLLLGFNEFDQFQTGRPLLGDVDGAGGASYLENNGIGLARGGDARDDLLPVISDVTVPPLKGFAPLLSTDGYASLLGSSNNAALSTGVAAGQLLGNTSYAQAFSDPTFSVFDRIDDPATAKDEYVDFVDNDGDGVDSGYLADSINTSVAQAYNLDTDNSTAETRLSSSGGAPNRPWDRIVALNCLQLGKVPVPLAGGVSNAYAQDAEIYTVADLNAGNDPDLNKLARVILRGGILPNYPEHDGIDNDGDGATATNFVTDQVLDDSTPANLLGEGIIGLDYYPGALDTDLVDNDLNGFADVLQVAADVDGDTRVITRGPIRLPVAGVDLPGASEWPDPLLSEGVDEGGKDLSLPLGVGQFFDAATGEIRGRRYAAAGSYEAWPLPVVFFSDRFGENNLFGSVAATEGQAGQIATLNTFLGIGSYLKLIDDPTATDITSVPGIFGFTPAFTIDVRPNLTTDIGAPYAANFVAFLGNASDVDYGALIKGPRSVTGNVMSGNAPYLGTRADSPEWRAFIERRWNPGDNVIVTLYQGRAATRAVADRVTYREYDVINRTIDDGFPSPYQALDLVGSTAYPVGLNPDYDTLWLPDQMGLDFYRSLERKDPRYAGDRFGTRNRWEATDGNYDDWAESLSFANPSVSVTGPAATWAALVAGNAGDDNTWRFGLTDDVTTAKNRRLFGHAFFGSPLRMNTAARIAQDPADLVALLDSDNAQVSDGNAIDAIAGRPYTQFESIDIYPRPGDGQLMRNFDWSQRKTFVANRPFDTDADLARVPFTTYEHALGNVPGGAFLFPQTPSNLRMALPTGGVGSGGANFRLDPNLRSGVLGFDETDSANRQNLLVEASDNFATDSLTLTVGQASFRPILPITNGVLDWQDVATGQLPPGTWVPVSMFALPGDLPLSYPDYPDGTNGGAVVEPFYLFNIDFLANRAPAPFGDIFGLDALASLNGGTVTAADLGLRWPQAQRAVAYVARAPLSPSPTERPEAVWSWDADDGLENGEYTLYIGTYLPGASQRLFDIQSLLANMTGINAGGVNITPYSEPLITEDGAEFLRLDPTNATNTGNVFAPRFTFEIITEPTLAQGYAPPQGSAPAGFETQVQPGLTRPEDWFPGGATGNAIGQTPRSDGYILYGSSANGIWRPQRVKITKNFLAIRIRQEGEAGECAVFTHVVLSPRKRTAGRVNLNTAENRVVPIDSGGERELFNPLLGVPGVFDVLTTTRDANGNTLGVPIADNDNFAPVGVIGTGPWPAPEAFTTWNDAGRTLHPMPPFVFQDSPFSGATPLLPTLDRLADTNGGQAYADEASALRMTSLLLAGRTRHADGRYYDHLGDLLRPSSRVWPSYNATPYDTDPYAGAYDPSAIGLRNFAVKEAQRLSPLSNAPRSQDRFDETIARLRRMGNSLTTRSDVFEILVTVQSGYGVDTNGDGTINYRTSDEFVTTGEKKARMVYERRAPADRTDEADLGVN